METEQTTEGAADTTTSEGEGETATETISIPKADYDRLNQTVGSLKREIKDYKKSKDEPKETPKSNQKPDSDALLQKLERMSLRQAGLTDPEDVELARKTAEKWGVDVDEVLGDEDFKVKLERQQTARSNKLATSNVRGGTGNAQQKFSPEYWIAKGQPPSVADVPDRKQRAKIARAMMANSKSGKKFYND